MKRLVKTTKAQNNSVATSFNVPTEIVDKFNIKRGSVVVWYVDDVKEEIIIKVVR